jgi:hypothetical protein
MPKESPQPGGEVILFQTEDAQTNLQVRLDSQTAWLTQAQMAELFQTTPQNITFHLKAIYGEGELSEAATCKDYLQVRPEGKRQKAELEFTKFRAVEDAKPNAVEKDFEAAVKMLKLPRSAKKKAN